MKLVVYHNADGIEVLDRSNSWRLVFTSGPRSVGVVARLFHALQKLGLDVEFRQGYHHDYADSLA
jgi:hypothetical protein